MTLNFQVLIYVSLACRSWNAACCYPIHWKTLDSALRFSCGNLSSLVFHFSLFINDDHLIMLNPGPQTTSSTNLEAGQDLSRWLLASAYYSASAVALGFLNQG